MIVPQRELFVSCNLNVQVTPSRSIYIYKIFDFRSGGWNREYALFCLEKPQG